MYIRLPENYFVPVISKDNIAYKNMYRKEEELEEKVEERKFHEEEDGIFQEIDEEYSDIEVRKNIE